MEVRTMNYGGIILSIKVPDRKGAIADVVLGHDTLTSSRSIAKAWASSA
jgi:aldose 1-epimerase